MIRRTVTDIYDALLQVLCVLFFLIAIFPILTLLNELIPSGVIYQAFAALLSVILSLVSTVMFFGPLFVLLDIRDSVKIGR